LVDQGWVSSSAIVLGAVFYQVINFLGRYPATGFLEVKIKN